MNAGDWVAAARAQLELAGFESCSLEAQLIAAKTVDASRSELLAHPGKPIDVKTADALLRRRLEHEPLAYILGFREFYGRKFAVDPSVLIPRQETEVLIEAWLALESKAAASARVLDLGTGSGCIGITLKLERPNLHVTLSDVSGEALCVASTNAKALGANVAIHRGDVLQGLGEFDAIVTNPPYVAFGDPLPPEVGRYEPHQALFAGKDGLEFYKRLAVDAPSYLSPGGRLLAEVGDSMAASVKAVFEQAGWRHLQTFEDLLHAPRVLALIPPEP